MTMVQARDTRYQAAIIENDLLLLIHWRDQEPDRSFWVIPGGAKEPGESAQECLVREMREETSLEVGVERFLYEETGRRNGKYWSRRTYLCSVLGGQPSAGYEPEDPQPEGYGIVEVAWFNLHDESGWDALLIEEVGQPLLKSVDSRSDTNGEPQALSQIYHEHADVFYELRDTVGKFGELIADDRYHGEAD
jgi:ADP-ribose pyrophosphatase YjhB (NUDIX family)